MEYFLNGVVFSPSFQVRDPAAEEVVERALLGFCDERNGHQEIVLVDVIVFEDSEVHGLIEIHSRVV
jgi:hypothetical protein